MNEIDKFLEPITGENPAGKDLKYVLHDKIREARRQEDSAPAGLWERDTKAADFKQVIKLSEDALLKSSKDLWIAAWLAEAWIYKYGVPGLTSGLQLMQGLVERFWDSIYPQLDDGDAEPRATPVDWVGSYFDPSKGSSPVLALRSVGLTQSGHNWFEYVESRRIGYEAEVSGSESRRKAREQAIKDGKLTPEDFDKDFEATPKQFYKDIDRDLKAAVQGLASLDELCRDKFADVAPSFTNLRKALDEVGNIVRILLLKKLEKEPDPVETADAAVTAEEAAPGAAQSPTPEPYVGIAAQIDLSKLASGEVKDAEQAALHVIAAAQYFRRHIPASPISYMLVRGLRWGEMRGATDVSTADLPAPAAEVRVALKRLAAAKNWKTVLEHAEAAMSTPAGRAWLDVQRYSIKACDELGYTQAAKALRSALKAFLQDFPELAAATLNDDTGTANPETLAWLRQETLIS